MLEVGISSNNECGNSISEICDRVKRAGFNNLMVAFKSGKAEDSIIEAQKYGLKIPYVHLDAKFADDLWARGETNKDYIKDIKEQIRLCAKYNINIAVLHGTSGSASNLALPPSQHVLDCMKEILKEAEKNNVKIALENLDKPNFEQFRFLMDNIDSKWLGFCYDVGHHHLYYPEFDIMAKYGDRLIAVHIHDNLMDWEYGYDYTRDLHMLPFDGKIDFEKVCQKIANTNYDNVVMLELHKESCGDPRTYDNVNVEDYLNMAHERATKLAEMIKKYRD